MTPLRKHVILFSWGLGQTEGVDVGIGCCVVVLVVVVLVGGSSQKATSPQLAVVQHASLLVPMLVSLGVMRGMS